VERLLTPEFPLINLLFCFDTFQYKFHHTCTRSGAWRTTMTTELTSREAAIGVLSVWKERFWCAHCSRGLLFPVACSDHPSCLVEIVYIHLFSFSVNTSSTEYENNGQGNFFLNSYMWISISASSIIMRLTSISLTGQSLQIKVHQPFSLRLHLVWEYEPGNVKKKESCTERIFSCTMTFLNSRTN